MLLIIHNQFTVGKLNWKIFCNQITGELDPSTNWYTYMRKINGNRNWKVVWHMLIDDWETERNHYERTCVDIKFSVHDAFLEYPSSGTLKTKILQCQIILKIFGSKKTKEPKQNIQNRLRSPMHEGGVP